MYSETEEIEPHRLIGSSRLSLALIGFAGFAILYAQRVDMSVALVCMLNHTALSESQITQNRSVKSVVSCDSQAGRTNMSTTNQKHSMADGEFTWQKQQQGIVLGSFFWGYLISQMPGGLLAERYGGKRVLFTGMLFASICTCLIPLAASIHYVLLLLMRMGTGLGGGVVFPAGHALWARWAPPLERSILVALMYSGTQIGLVLTLPVSGLLCDTVGWPFIFYILGPMGVVWTVVWWLFVADSPEQSQRISITELRYIHKSQEILSKNTETPRSERETPWLKIFSSGAVWSIIVSHTSCAFSAYLMMLTLPSYMKEVLNFDIKANGLLSSIPYVAFFISMQLFAHLSDFLRRKELMSTKNVRKCVMAIALLGQSSFLVLAGYCSCGQEYLAVACIIVSQFLGGARFSGYGVNHVDIAPKYAGTLYGISNSFATCCGFIAPIVATALTPDGSLEQWRLVFWVSCAVSMFGLLFFVCFAKGDIQSWAKDDHDYDHVQQSSEEKQILDSIAC